LFDPPPMRGLDIDTIPLRILGRSALERSYPFSKTGDRHTSQSTLLRTSLSTETGHRRTSNFTLHTSLTVSLYGGWTLSHFKRSSLSTETGHRHTSHFTLLRSSLSTETGHRHTSLYTSHFTLHTSLIIPLYGDRTSIQHPFSLQGASGESFTI